MGRIIQGTNEIIMNQGDVFTAAITPKDGKGDDIAIDGQTLASLTFKAYEYIDDTTEAFSVASVVHSTTVINVTFTAPETSGESPQTYIYILKGTVNGSARTLAKNIITILRAQ